MIQWGWNILSGYWTIPVHYNLHFNEEIDDWWLNRCKYLHICCFCRLKRIQIIWLHSKLSAFPIKSFHNAYRNGRMLLALGWLDHCGRRVCPPEDGTDGCDRCGPRVTPHPSQTERGRLLLTNIWFCYVQQSSTRADALKYLNLNARHFVSWSKNMDRWLRLHRSASSLN